MTQVFSAEVQIFAGAGGGAGLNGNGGNGGLNGQDGSPTNTGGGGGSINGVGGIGYQAGVNNGGSFNPIGTGGNGGAGVINQNTSGGGAGAGGNGVVGVGGSGNPLNRGSGGNASQTSGGGGAGYGGGGGGGNRGGGGGGSSFVSATATNVSFPTTYDPNYGNGGGGSNLLGKSGYVEITWDELPPPTPTPTPTPTPLLATPTPTPQPLLTTPTPTPTPAPLLTTPTPTPTPPLTTPTPMPIPVISDICFPAGTPIKTDQGVINIELLQTGIHTIRGQVIEHVTQTVTRDNYLIAFEPSALDYNVPTKTTIMSKDHCIVFKGQLVPAHRFLNPYYDYYGRVKKVTYSGEILYNVLLATHGVMEVNNMRCETLHPANLIAKMYKGSTTTF
jgi:hypothetical protein